MSLIWALKLAVFYDWFHFSITFYVIIWLTWELDRFVGKIDPLKNVNTFLWKAEPFSFIVMKKWVWWTVVIKFATDWAFIRIAKAISLLLRILNPSFIENGYIIIWKLYFYVLYLMFYFASYAHLEFYAQFMVKVGAGIS